ncbi:MAG TPA: hypothetical protein PLF40_08715 [Kofleriaceae bacterium]|nr:hypothetical protein [Kofleriaceae bacterium]
MKTSWFAGVAFALVVGPATAHAGPYAGVSFGRAGQSDSLVETGSKSLFVGLQLTRNLSAELSLESLAVEEQSCETCSTYTLGEGRGIGIVGKYRLIDHGFVQPFLSIGIANETFGDAYNSSYTRSEVGVGVAVPISPQIRIIGELRTGVRNIDEQPGDVYYPAVEDSKSPTPLLYYPSVYNDGAAFRSAQLGVAVSF